MSSVTLSVASSIALLGTAVGVGVLLGVAFAYDAQIKAIYRRTFATSKGYQLCEPMWLRLVPFPAVILAIVMLVISLSMILEFGANSLIGLLAFSLFCIGYAVGQGVSPKHPAYYHALMISTLQRRSDQASKVLLRSLGQFRRS